MLDPENAVVAVLNLEDREGHRMAHRRVVASGTDSGYGGARPARRGDAANWSGALLSCSTRGSRTYAGGEAGRAGGGAPGGRLRPRAEPRGATPVRGLPRRAGLGLDLAAAMKRRATRRVPGDNFYVSARRSDASHGQRYLRFAFCRSLGVLRDAAERLAAMSV